MNQTEFYIPRFNMLKFKERLQFRINYKEHSLQRSRMKAIARRRLANPHIATHTYLFSS